MEPGNDWLGLDIGGANLKAATTGGLAEEIPFPLWKHPEHLTRQLKSLRKLVPRIDRVAVTMTGELCDCFQSKQEGVLHIVDAVETAFQGTLVWYWSNGGEWLGSKVARGFPYRLAASNWLALCQYLADTVVREPTVLVDMGSTTTDILFLSNGAVLCQGRDDPGRLNSGELVYTGLTRSPICSLVQDGYCAEVFATTLDAHLVLGSLEENPGRSDSADGRPWTREKAHARIARMLGADLETSTRAQREDLARAAISTQWARIARGIQQVMQRNGNAKRFILGGQGADWIGQRLLDSGMASDIAIHRLRDIWGENGSRVACARAVSQLAKAHEKKT